MKILAKTKFHLTSIQLPNFNLHLIDKDALLKIAYIIGKQSGSQNQKYLDPMS